MHCILYTYLIYKNSCDFKLLEALFELFCHARPLQRFLVDEAVGDGAE